MVQATISPEQTPNLIPAPPEWLERQHQANAPNQNRNINDIYWAKGPHEADPGWIIVGPSAIIGSEGRMITRQAESWARKGRVPLIEYSYTDRISTITNIEADETRSAQTRWRDMWVAVEFVVQHPLVGAGVGQNILAMNEAM